MLQRLHRADAPLRRAGPGHPPARHARDRGHAGDDPAPHRARRGLPCALRRRLLLRPCGQELRHPLRAQPGPDACRRARGGQRREARPLRLCPLEGRQARRAQLAQPLGRRSPRLAHRVLRDDPPLPGHPDRHPRRRRRPHLPAPRERDRPGHVRLGLRARQHLDAHRHAARGRREDVQEPRQLLHAQGGARQVPRRRRAPAHAADPLPRAARLLLRAPGGRGRHARAPADLRAQPPLGRRALPAGRRAQRRGPRSRRAD